MKNNEQCVTASPCYVTLEFLSRNERLSYVEALYAIAKDAIAVKCPALKVKDLEILAALEEKSDAVFEEWLNGRIINSGS